MGCHRFVASLLIAIVGAGAGCLRAAESTCASGEVCPEGYACLTGGGCLSPAQLAACDGIEPGASCEFGALDGVCQDGGCVVVGCGNGTI